MIVLKLNFFNFIPVIFVIFSVFYFHNVYCQIRNDINSNKIYSGETTDKPKYAVLAPKLVRPESIYAVAVVALPGLDRSMIIRTALSRNGVEITASEKAELRPESVLRMLMRVPGSSVPGTYSLRIDGDSITRGAGATTIANTTLLEFSSRFLTIIIQTSRPIYCVGQDGENSKESIVRFRVILLNMDMRPFEESVNVYILDPDGYIMRRWVSAETNNGVVSLFFQLPRLAKEGKWQIKVEARNQIENQSFEVHTHFVPIFEVLVFSPQYVVDSDEYFTVTINAISSSERLAKGNATISVFGEYFKSKPKTKGPELGPKLLWTENIFVETGIHSWDIKLKDIEAHMGALAGVQVKAEISVFETFYGYNRSGYSHTRIIGGDLKLRFLGAAPQIFRPGMPFEGQIAISYDDYEKVPEEILKDAKLLIKGAVITDTGARIDLNDVSIPSSSEYEYKSSDTDDWNEHDSIIRIERYVETLSFVNFRSKGIHTFKFDIPKRSLKLELNAMFTAKDGTVVTARLQAERYYSPLNKYISVVTSTEDVKPGQYAVFHIRTSFPVDNFIYMVMSKGLLLLADTLESKLGVTTFSIPVSPEMCPAFRLVALAVTRQGEIVSDSVWVPVEGLSMHKASLQLNEAKDHTRETVEFQMKAQPGAYFATQTLNIFMYQLQAGSEITRGRVLKALHSFENDTRFIHRIAWRSRDGTREDESNYFKSLSYGPDANRTLEAAGLLIFTDAIVPEIPFARDGCNETDYIPCAIRGCYHKSKKCDGSKDCPDGSDENLCHEDDDFSEQIAYSIWRQSGYTDLYQLGDGDWGWYECNIAHHGREYKHVAIAAVSNSWYVSAFSVSKEFGMTVVSGPQIQDSSRPLFASVEGASQCRSGEQVSIRLMIFNRRTDVHEMLVTVILHASDDYKFVHVEPDGIVTSYGARLTGGEHHHLVWLPEGGEIQVDLPVAPTVARGEVEVSITVSTQYGIRRLSHTINVYGEGAPVSGHTAVFLDLKSRATVLRYLDIPVEESPIVPYHDWRRYIYGSPYGTIMLTSDLIGPVFPEVPITTVTLVDRWLKGTEARVSELAANVWTLHYLRLTNRLKKERLREVLAHVTTIFTQVMMRFNGTTGGFYNWDYSPTSVWVTSWAVRAFRHASFQDWEDYFYVEPNIINKAVKFLLENQSPSGGFYEHDPVYAKSPLDQRMHGSISPRTNTSTNWWDINEPRNISLTAHVLITLQEALPAVQGQLRSDAASAKDRALRYLERQLGTMKDPYEICITAYALTLADSIEKELAYRKLAASVRTAENAELYWARNDIPSNPIKYENQRPFIQPDSIVEGDSIAIEATSYGLLTYILREGAALTPERIVQWLAVNRVTYLGYYSTVESVLALQALTEYAFRERLLDITEMSVTLELPSSGTRHELNVFGNESGADYFSDVIPSVWSHLNVVARGRGQALVQMDVAWGVDYEELKDAPTNDSFELLVHEYYSDFRNKSSITIQTCFRWVRPYPLTSGAAVLEMELPSGYHMLETDAINLVRSGIHPTLKEGLTIPGKTLWFFEHIPPLLTCFNHTVLRWYPVANISLQRSAFLYEMYARERFVQTLVNSTPLYVLNICEVCGSYQCPYCPHYSGTSFTLPSIVLLLASLFTVFYNYICLPKTS